jgi:hypothetical protein
LVDICSETETHIHHQDKASILKHQRYSALCQQPVVMNASFRIGPVALHENLRACDLRKPYVKQKVFFFISREKGAAKLNRAIPNVLSHPMLPSCKIYFSAGRKKHLTGYQNKGNRSL